MRPRHALLLAAVLAIGACRAGQKGQQEGEAETETPRAVPSVPGATTEAPAGKLLWGPEAVSSASRGADGLGAALGVGQVGIVWIEDRSPGADVFFARVAGQDVGQAISVTKGASSFPPMAVAWTGKEFALAWGDDRFRHIEIFVARVSYSGKLVLRPRRFTSTQSDEDEMPGVFSADSSQAPALAYYGGQLLMAWGGPGNAGRQQVYYTTLSKAGKPNFDPTPLTRGLSDAVGIRLVSYETGALLSYCVRGSEGNELYRLHLSGSPPGPAQPMKVEVSQYVPCSVKHALAGDGAVVLWAMRAQDEGGAVEDGLEGQLVDADGVFVGKSFEMPGVRLVKFPGKHRAPFDALELGGGKLAIAWIERVPDGSASLRLGVFDAAGNRLGEPFEVPTQADPTDPHLLGSGQPGSFVVTWLDRPLGSKLRRVFVAGVSFEIP
ncbi:MAG: hypothetical protein JRG91_02860 [Deltaproteobacteria bacterium]|nr:hypothetical protein [Deltaproteobacteria bacterium]